MNGRFGKAALPHVTDPEWPEWAGRDEVRLAAHAKSK